MLNITNYQGNANQNHNDISPHTFRMATIKKTQEITSVGEGVEKLEHLCTVGGNVKWVNVKWVQAIENNRKFQITI